MGADLIVAALATTDPDGLDFDAGLAAIEELDLIGFDWPEAS